MQKCTFVDSTSATTDPYFKSLNLVHYRSAIPQPQAFTSKDMPSISWMFTDQTHWLGYRLHKKQSINHYFDAHTLSTPAPTGTTLLLPKLLHWPCFFNSGVSTPLIPAELLIYGHDPYSWQPDIHALIQAERNIKPIWFLCLSLQLCFWGRAGDPDTLRPSHLSDSILNSQKRRLTLQSTALLRSGNQYLLASYSWHSRWWYSHHWGSCQHCQ